MTELLHYTPPPPPGIRVGVSKILKFYVKVFYVMGKALSGKLSFAQTGLFDMIPMFRFATVRENIWKMKVFPGQGKVREFCRWPGKFRKDLESQGI